MWNDGKEMRGRGREVKGTVERGKGEEDEEGKEKRKRVNALSVGVTEQT